MIEKSAIQAFRQWFSNASPGRFRMNRVFAETPLKRLGGGGRIFEN